MHGATCKAGDRRSPILCYDELRVRLTLELIPAAQAQLLAGVLVLLVA